MGKEMMLGWGALAAFAVFLGLSVWQDIRYRRLDGRLLAGFGLVGTALRLSAAWLLWKGGGVWQEVLLDGCGAALLGAALLALGRAARGALGEGDGCFFLVSGLYLGFRGNIALFFASLMACFLFCCPLLLWGRWKGVSMRKRQVPFLPFVALGALGMAVW